MTTTTPAGTLRSSTLSRAVFGLTPLLLGAACASGNLEEEGRPATETTTLTTGTDDTGTVTGETGSDDPADGPQPPPTDQLPALVKAILERNCVTCHGAGSQASGGIDYINDLKALVDNGKVVPYQPDTSPLYLRVAAGTMPPGGETQRPGDGDADTIRAWIDDGAKPGDVPSDCKGQAIITYDDMFIAMNADLLSADISQGDLPFIRYLTITHLYNDGICSKDLDIYRQAAAKMTNSLSTGPDVISLHPIRDTEDTIFRIDLRDFGWDQNLLLGDVWEAVASENPFAIKFAGDLGKALRLALATDVPNQPLDSFLQVATRGQLYYDILQIPATLTELQQSLGIDIADDIADGRAFRAGIEVSGVSQFNRAFDRHPLGADRYYYESSDFNSAVADANIFIHPLDFVRAGGEVIFSLENGFQGYAIEAGGTIIAEAPIAVVADPTQRDFTVRAGVSCMGCHQAGIIARDDEFRDYYDKHKQDFNNDRDTIETFFDKDAMHAKQAGDIKEFAEVMARAAIPVSGREPIIFTSLDFEADLDLRRAAGELGVSADELQDELAALDDQLDRLSTGKVSRDVFAAVFADTACALIPGDRAFPDCFVPN